MTLNAAQTAELTAALAAHDLPTITQRLRKAIERERRGGTVKPDGWPRGRADGPGGGAKITVQNEHGDPESVPVTAVELTVIGREHPQRDPLADLVNSAIKHAQNALAALDALNGKLIGIDNLGRAVIDPDDDIGPGCSSCIRYLDAIGNPHRVKRFRGDLCKWCYGIVNDKDLNPERKLPPLELIARHARMERIRVSDVTRALRGPVPLRSGSTQLRP